MGLVDLPTFTIKINYSLQVNTPSTESLVPSVQVTNGVAMWHFRVANVKLQTETTVLRQPEKLRKKLDT